MICLLYTLASQESQVAEIPCSKAIMVYIALVCKYLAFEHSVERPPALEIQVSGETPTLSPELFTLKSA